MALKAAQAMALPKIMVINTKAINLVVKATPEAPMASPTVMETHLVERPVVAVCVLVKATAPL